MKKYFFFLFFLFVSLQIYGQTPYIEWQKCLGGSWDDWLVFMIMTKDGGLVLACDTPSNDGDITGNHGDLDAWIVKMDQAGKVIWQKCIGGSQVENITSITETKDGGFIITGSTVSNDGDITGNHGDYDAWILKLDQSGQIVWNKCLGGSQKDYAYSIIETENEDFIALCRTYSNDGDVSGNHGNLDVWIVKLDRNGNILWNKCLGGSEDDIAISIIETEKKEIIAFCNTYSNDGDVSGNHGNKDLWILKLEQSGHLLWQKCLGGSDNDNISSIIESNDGGYIINGETKSIDGNISDNHGKQDVWVVKLDQSGQILWQKCFGGSEYDFACSIINVTDSGYLLAISSYSNDGIVIGNHGGSDVWIVNMNESGEILWQNCFGGTHIELVQSVIMTTDKGYMITAVTYSNDGNVSGKLGTTDVWVVKLDQSGHLIWQNCLGGSKYDDPDALIQVDDDEYILAASTTSNDGDVSRNREKSTDIWLVKLGVETSVFEEETDNNITIVSSSNSDNIIIKTNLTETDNDLKMYNIYGQVVYSGRVEQEISVDISDFAAGTYFITVGNERCKFLKY